MSNQPVRIFPIQANPLHELGGARLGSIVEIAPDGRPLVRIVGRAQPVYARVATTFDSPDPSSAVGSSVVLVFESANPDLPIIVGFVRDTLCTARPTQARTEVAGENGRSFELNGRTVVLEGKDEVILRCGLGSLTIRADGQVIMKGTRLTSKASETNKIRGASVLIN